MEKIIIPVKDTDSISDGFHTFGELYQHRVVLFIALCRLLSRQDNAIIPGGTGFIWASTRHSDGTSFGDWFVLGIGVEKGTQITYHIPARYWDRVCEFAKVLPKAPEFDGHTPEDVLKRITNL